MTGARFKSISKESKATVSQLISQLTYRQQKALKPNFSIWLPWVVPIFPNLYFIDWASTWAGWQFVIVLFIVVWLPILVIISGTINQIQLPG